MIDYHALAPELILAGTLLVVLFVDLFLEESRKWLGAMAGIFGLTLAALPLLTLAFDGTPRAMFGGSYVVDDFALVLKGFFIVTGYVVLLMSVSYVEDDRLYQGEFYFLLLTSILGGVVMASSRDLVTIFVGLELVSAPAFLLAGWRKGDARSNEAALKFFIIGVLSAAILLYGMAMVYGTTGEITFVGIRNVTPLVADEPAFLLGVLFVLVGFGFKVSAVPFHFWAPDTYEGAPTPVAAYLSVGSKAAGFVGMLVVAYFAFGGVPNVWGPALWILAALSMTVGNLIAIRQTNIVRLLAYSSIAQAGFMLAPFGVAGVVSGADLGQAFSATITYMLIYGLMNLGAFAVVLAGSRKTRTGDIDGWAGLGTYAPRLGFLLSIFFFSLAGIPPLAGWFAKLVMFRAVMAAGLDSAWAGTLAAIAAVNAVIALYYYARVVKSVWMDPVPDTAPADDVRLAPVSPSLGLALGLTALAVVVVGVLPGIIATLADAAGFFLTGG